MQNFIAKVWLRVAGPLTVALVLSGCSGSILQVNPNPDPSPAHASATFLYMANSVEATVKGSSINGSTGALTRERREQLMRASCSAIQSSSQHDREM